MGPVKRMSGTQIITSPYGDRTLDGKKRFHRGVDLRTRRFIKGKGYVPQWGLQKIITTEPMKVLRFGTDSYGNDFIVLEPLASGYDEIKYIHITLDESVKKVGKCFMKGEFLGYSQVKGSSRAHHLHFETWIKGKHIDPRLYFKMLCIKYKRK